MQEVFFYYFFWTNQVHDLRGIMAAENNRVPEGS